MRTAIALALLAVLVPVSCRVPDAAPGSGPARAEGDGGAVHDLVLLGGRVIDPESGLDAVRNVGVLRGEIAVVTAETIRGREEIDARGLVVAPGFIDLHSHGQDPENYALKARDGVTAALELEVGAADIDRWYAEREGKSLVHFGVSAGHIPIRMAVKGDPPAFLPPSTARAATEEASDAEIAEIVRRVERGLDRGAVAVGFGIQYTPAASRWEVIEVFRAAARRGASCHVHLRHGGAREPRSGTGALEEVLACAAVTGAPLHVVHIHSSSLGSTGRHLRMIGEARARGLDVTTECYPYTFGMTDISSGVFDEGWRESLGIDYQHLVFAATGERLTAESFERYRKQGGFVAVHSIPEEVVREAVTSPLTMIASDGIMKDGKGHPRAAGAYARVLGRFVRQEKALGLPEALRKMTLDPARRLERLAPLFARKGRVRAGADADLVLFDPERVIDRATSEEPALPPEGIRHVLVGGVAVVRSGELVPGVLPGKPLRAPVR